MTRNYVIGLEVVLANGEVLRTGGRVQKNKTGFDLLGLFVGSEGMLGVVTEITLRLLPLPPARATLSAAFATAPQAAEAVQAIFEAGFLPSAVEIADHFTLEAARRDLGEKIVPEGNAHLLVDLDGQQESVRSEAAAICELVEIRKPNALQMANDEADCEKLWALRRQFSNSLRATGLTKLNEDVVVPRSHLVDLMEFADKLQGKHVRISSVVHLSQPPRARGLARRQFAVLSGNHNASLEKNALRIAPLQLNCAFNPR